MRVLLCGSTASKQVRWLVKEHARTHARTKMCVQLFSTYLIVLFFFFKAKEVIYVCVFYVLLRYP